MAPEPETLKRKRSRPSDWWTASSPTTVQQHPLKQETEQQPEYQSGSNPIEHTSEEQPSGQTVDNAITTSETPQPTQIGTSKRKRSRPSDWWAVDNQGPLQENEPAPKRQAVPPTSGPKRAIKDNGSAVNRGKRLDHSVIVGTDENADVRTKPSKRRPKPDSAAQPRDREQTVGNSSLSTSKKRGRPRKQQTGEHEVIDVQTASSSFGGARPKTGRVVKSPKHESSHPTKKHKGPSSSAASRRSVEDPKDLEKADELRKIKRPRVREAVQEEENDSQVADESHHYQHLAPMTRRVPRNAIAAKWEALPPSCIEYISQLLADLQKPVTARLRDEHRRTQTSTVLQMISRRLVSKISKGLPFPPGTNRQREDDFNFEKIINRNSVLDSQLTAAIDGNKLLDASLSNEMALLESETAALSELETNAKAEARKMKQTERKLHPLLQPDGSTAKDGMDDIGLVSKSVPPMLGTLEDENMQALVQNLESHVDSMDGNLEQVRGISEAMAKTKAAVQVVIFDHLDRTRSEEAVLGAE